MNEHNPNIAAELIKLAATSDTGAVRITGPPAGAIYLRTGCITYAESARTPSLANAASSRPALAPNSELAQLTHLTEATVDAAVDLLTDRSTCARFCPGVAAPVRTTLALPVKDLLAEVARRCRLLSQLQGLTADTALTTNPHLASERVQLSAPDWAVLLRVRGGATPRELALALRRSVFSTTTDVYRLMALGLVRAEAPRPASDGAGPPASRQVAATFIRALSDQKGASAMPNPRLARPSRQAGA